MSQSSPPMPRFQLSNYAICIFSGALAGIVVAVLILGIKVAFDIWQSQVTILEYFELGLPWFLVLEDIFEHLGGSTVSGAIGGLFTGLFSRQTRRPYVLASIWASILGTVGLVIGMMVHFLGFGEGQPVEFALMIGAYLAVGAVYGFVMGVFSYLIEKQIDRFRRRPTGPAVSPDRQSA